MDCGKQKIKSIAGAVLLVLLSACYLCGQTPPSKEDVVYIQQTQYMQETTQKQVESLYSNIGIISQNGNGHQAALEQYGYGLKANIDQRGSNNTAHLSQNGEFLEANISQKGSEHEVNVSQSGSYLRQEISQKGNGHQLNISQYGNLSGSEMPFSYSQSGNNSNCTIILEGNAPPVEVIQYR